MKVNANILYDRKCVICGKLITTLHPSIWAYKFKMSTANESYTWCCSWTCYRKAWEEARAKKPYKKAKRYSKRP